MMPALIEEQTIRAIYKHTADVFPKLRAIRRDLHQHPELSGGETRTAHQIAENLKHLGLAVRANVGRHGIVADLITDPALPTVALRVDMDALPIHELNQMPYRSTIPGVMHACGHDVHSAVGIGVALVLSKFGRALPGNVRFIFQPEEEQITGALRMIRDGALTDPTPIAIFGLHVAPLPAGQIAWSDGLFLAGFDHYLATLKPQTGVNLTPSDLDKVAKRCVRAILRFNQWQLPETWQAMQTFWGWMQTDSHELRHFIIYDASMNDEDPEMWHGQFGIGIKAATPNLRLAALGRIKARLSAICQATHTQYHLEHAGTMPDMINNTTLVRSTFPALSSAFMPQQLLHLRAAFPFNCEDFAYYTKYIPGAMFWLGAADPENGKFALLHTPDFDVDEECIATGTTALSVLLYEALLHERI